MPYHRGSSKSIRTNEVMDEVSPWFEVGLFAVVCIAGILFSLIPIVQMLLDGIRIWIHEFGHAMTAWMFGRRAIPLPIGWTNVDPDRSIIVYLCVLSLLGFWAYYAYIRERYLSMLYPIGIAILQLVSTWMTSPMNYEFYLAIGGIRGEFILSSILIAMFFARLPPYFKWAWLRVPVLFGAVFCFARAFQLWHQIRSGLAEIPWGTALGGADDAGGDMNTIQDSFGWTDERIVSHFVNLSHLCLGILLTIFIVKMVRVWNGGNRTNRAID